MKDQSMVDGPRSMANGRWSIAAKRGEAVGTGGRMGRFSVVGAIGIGVQLVALALLQRAGIDYLIATALAVEVTILHNFVWHERYTWVDRTSVSPRDWLHRLISFNLTNGGISLLGNVVLMRWLVGEAHLPVIPANFLAITGCWLLNFVVSDRVVFRRCPGITSSH